MNDNVCTVYTQSQANCSRMHRTTRQRTRCTAATHVAHVIQRQRTSHTLYNKATHVAHVVQSKADKWSDRWTVRPLWGAASEKRESWRLPPLRPVLYYFIGNIMLLENKMAMLWPALLCILQLLCICKKTKDTNNNKNVAKEGIMDILRPPSL